MQRRPLQARADIPTLPPLPVPLSSRGLKKAEGQFWKLALSPPGKSNRTDKSRLLAVLGISEIEYIARYTSPIHTDWVMRCTPRKVLRTA